MSGSATTTTGRSATFRHGVHPSHNKAATEGQPIERVRFVQRYVLPLGQHIGAPSRAIVQKGDKVMRGQLIAEPGGFISTALHSPVTGTVAAIERRLHPGGKDQESIVIDIDPFADQAALHEPEPHGGALPSKELVTRVQRAGIVGLGGAGFPSHVKLSIPDARPVKYVMLNGCECEPYLTCDHRVMLEHPERVLRGLRLLLEQTGAERGYVGVEDNKPDAIEVLRATNAGAADPDRVVIAPLQTKYPQGAEKMMIDAIIDREVPSGKLPLDIETVVVNVATAAAIADLHDHGTPLIERVVTVTGDGIRRPANVLVPIGTPLSEVLAHCGGLHREVRQVVLGGPMMGSALKSLDVPIIKGVSGIIALREPVPVHREMACIRCSRCLDACPIFLNPSRLHKLVRAERPEELLDHHMLDCFECASCSFVCPSHIPLVQLMRVGKGQVRLMLAKQKEAAAKQKAEAAS